MSAALKGASDQDASEYTSSLSKLLGAQRNRLTLWCERVLIKSTSSDLLRVTVDAARASSTFNEMQVSNLFDACLQFYRSGLIGVATLEDHWSDLVDSMVVNNDDAYKNPFYALGRGLSVARDVDLKSTPLSRLDASLARHAADYNASYYQDNVVRPLSWMCHEINLPQTYKQAAGWYKHQKDPDGMIFMLEATCRQGQIKSEQLKTFSEIYGASHLGFLFEKVVMYLPKLSNIKVFTENFSEEMLFTGRSLKKLLSENKKRCCLSIYDVLSEDGFDYKELPLFTSFCIMATPELYKTLTVNSEKLRTSIRKLNITMGRHLDVWRCEVEYYKRHISESQQKAVGEDAVGILSALKVSRPAEYKIALQTINEIGIAHMAVDLASAKSEFVNDFLKFVKMDAAQKISFMKSFPQSKATILEEDLGM